MYGRAIEFLEGALTMIPRPILFGGEVGRKHQFRYISFVLYQYLIANVEGLICRIHIWLAMAYKANVRHVDCIDLYQQLEKKHPSPGIQRQASELRYILQACKLKISHEEMVTIPMIGSTYDSYAVTRTEIRTGE